jgi:hypothetical protein
VSWAKRSVKVDLTKDEIRSSPEFGAEIQHAPADAQRDSPPRAK